MKVQELGQAPMAAFLQHSGMWKPEVFHVPERPVSTPSSRKDKRLIS
jgi:hypothetical protein